MSAQPITEDRHMDDVRLQRIESKLDSLTEAMSKLVAVETTQRHMNERIVRIETRLDKIDDRVRDVSNSEASSASGSAMFERLVLVLITAGLAVTGTLALEAFYPK